MSSMMGLSVTDRWHEEGAKKKRSRWMRINNTDQASWKKSISKMKPYSNMIYR